jgi:hypothetical protein
MGGAAHSQVHCDTDKVVHKDSSFLRLSPPSSDSTRFSSAAYQHLGTEQSISSSAKDAVLKAVEEVATREVFMKNGLATVVLLAHRDSGKLLSSIILSSVSLLITAILVFSMRVILYLPRDGPS